MTTVIGLHVGELNVALLAADRQGTLLVPNANPEKNLNRRKLFIGKSGEYAIGHSGLYDERTDELVQKIIAGNIDIRKAVDSKFFEELHALNNHKMGKKIPDLSTLSSFLAITRFDNKPALYTFWPLGEVESRGLTYIGSGGEKIEEYVKARQVLSEATNYIPNSKGSIEGVIRYGLEAVRFAQGKDIYSSGLDLVIATPNAMTDHEALLRDDFGKKLKSIQRIHEEKEKDKPKEQ